MDDRIGDAGEGASRKVTVNETPHLADSNQTTAAEPKYVLLIMFHNPSY